MNQWSSLGPPDDAQWETMWSFFNQYHQFHYLKSFKPAWTPWVGYVMSKQYVDKESYLSMCLSPTTNLKLGSSMPSLHPWAKSIISPKSEVLAWEGRPHSKWILPILISQLQGLLFREPITVFIVGALTYLSWLHGTFQFKSLCSVLWLDPT